MFTLLGLLSFPWWSTKQWYTLLWVPWASWLAVVCGVVFLFPLSVSFISFVCLFPLLAPVSWVMRDDTWSCMYSVGRNQKTSSTTVTSNNWITKLKVVAIEIPLCLWVEIYFSGILPVTKLIDDDFESSYDVRRKIMFKRSHVIFSYSSSLTMIIFSLWKPTGMLQDIN